MAKVLQLNLAVEDDEKATEALKKFKAELSNRVEQIKKENPFIWGGAAIFDNMDEAIREPKIYWFANKGILIFDAGYVNGSVHIYEEKDEKDAADLKELLSKYGHCWDWSIFPSQISFNLPSEEQ
jgi:hypothetical protein